MEILNQQPTQNMMTRVSYRAIYHLECPCCGTKFDFDWDDTKPWHKRKRNRRGREVRAVDCPWCSDTLKVWSDDICRVEKICCVLHNGQPKIVSRETTSKEEADEYLKWLKEN